MLPGVPHGIIDLIWVVLLLSMLEPQRGDDQIAKEL